MKTPLASGLAALVAAVALTAAAQPPKRPGFLTAMQLAATPQSLAPGASGVLTATLTVQPGYHIYAHEPGDKFLTATQFTPAKTPGVVFGKIQWPTPTVHDKARIHEGVVTISVPFTVSKTAKPGKRMLSVGMFAQGCNASDCFPPTKFSLSTPLSISAK